MLLRNPIASTFFLSLLTSIVSLGEDATPVFERDIRPILKANCFQCHGEEEELKGDLDLRLVKLIRHGGESGPAITPGDRTKSHLFELISKGEMPPKKEKLLKPEEIAKIGAWIDAGAKTRQPEPEQTPKPGEFFISPAERQHWSYQPIVKPPVPSIDSGSANPIDAFVAAKLAEKELTFSEQTDPVTLIRRASFDLLGLPPTPEEVQAFLADREPGSWERLIDRLLESPHYGERWGRHWLDVAGYADSEGYNDKDVVRDDAWRYRDYVIRAFNDEKPWDRFIIEQIAGDELAGATHANAQGLANAKPEACELLTATGFLRLAPDGSGSSPDVPLHARNQVITETINIVSSSLLGLTTSCAECHDHRFDPIPQEDFYKMRAIFAPVYDTENWRMPTARRAALLSGEDQKKADEIEARAKVVDQQYLDEMMRIVGIIFERELEKIPAELREFARKTYETPADKRTPEQTAFITSQYPAVNVQRGTLHLFLDKYPDKDELKKGYEDLLKQTQEIRKDKPLPDYIRVATEDTKSLPQTRLFHRGDFTSPVGDPLPPGEFAVLNAPNFPEKAQDLSTSGRRLAYAEYLTSGKHPLVARVLTNRFWMLHFGRGIVATPSEFGARGALPSHPELLDWLAADFMEGGWNLKRFHRQVMISRTWRQSSVRRPEGEAVDQDNTLLWRMPVRRLESEVIRDAMLAVSGNLNQTLLGAPVPVTVNDGGLFAVGGGKISEGAPELRRSIYVQQRRTQPVAMLQAFDAPQMEPNCERRFSSTVATQALELMNGDFALAQAADFANRVIAKCGEKAEPAELASRAWEIAFGAPPSDEESRELAAFLISQREAIPPLANDAKTTPEERALASFCQVLFETNRFLYVD